MPAIAVALVVYTLASPAAGARAELAGARGRCRRSAILPALTSLYSTAADAAVVAGVTDEMQPGRR